MSIFQFIFKMYKKVIVTCFSTNEVLNISYNWAIKSFEKNYTLISRNVSEPCLRFHWNVELPWIKYLQKRNNVLRTNNFTISNFNLTWLNVYNPTRTCLGTIWPDFFAYFFKMGFETKKCHFCVLRQTLRSKQVSFLLTLYRPLPPHPFFT